MSALDVLALGAHPDDAEAGCGGTLLRSRDAGLSIGIADLTDGELSTQGDPRTRARERDRASELLGLSVRVSLSLPDGGLDGGPAQRAMLVALLRELRPRFLLAPYPRDRHPDHAAAGQLARDVAFLAGVRRYAPGEQGDAHGDAHRPQALFHYMLHEPFHPTFVIDVSMTWERRMAAVRAYESQFAGAADVARTALAGPRFLAALDERAGYFGAMVGCERGEPFWSAGPLGLDGLPGGAGPRGYRMFV